MKLTAKIKNWIYNGLNPYKRNKKVSQCIYNFHYKDYGEFDYHLFGMYEITNVTARTVKGLLNVLVTLNRPGIFIGKGGKNIDAIESHLQRVLKRKVKILIKEETLWQFNKY